MTVGGNPIIDILSQKDVLVATTDMGVVSMHAKTSSDDKRVIELLVKA